MTSTLPGVLGEIASVAGEAAAIAVSARVGGTRVYIPARIDDGHWLVDCVGRAAADKICDHFAADGRGQRVDIPLATGGAYGQLKRAVAKRVHELDIIEEKSASQIARQVGITERTVQRHRAAHNGGKNDKQGRLL